MSRSRHTEASKPEMRERILETAAKMFVEQGFDQTSIRKIAKKIAYSPGTIYLYFPGGKDELFYTLHDQGFVEFGGRMREADAIVDPVERLKKQGEIYLRFAFENPEYYNLMFIETAPMETEETAEKWESGMRTYSCLEETVQSCIDQGYFKDRDLHQTTFHIWATMHGMVSLALRKRLKMYPEEMLHPMMKQVSFELGEMLKR